jgi:cell division protein FtsQ
LNDRNVHMKKRSLLSKQTVIKKQTKRRPILRDVLRFVTSVSFKASILIIGMVSVSLLFLYLYKYLVSSPYIKLREIQITGVDDGIKRELIKMSGLNKDLCLLTINPGEIKAKMERHPWIRSVELEKQFPHTLLIKAEKQLPRALVSFDKMYYMNRWGKVFKELDQDDNMDYPVITGISRSQDDTDEKLTLASGILDLFASETGLWSISNISEIHVNNGGDALVYSISLPFAVRIGGGNLEEEKNKLKQLVAHLENTGGIDAVKVIDMNYLDGAVVSFNKSDNNDPLEKQEDKTVGL